MSDGEIRRTSIQIPSRHTMYVRRDSRDPSVAAASILPPERLAQNRLILRIVNECAEKLKLSMIIPKIFENPLTVCHLLKGTPYEVCGEELLKYLRTRNTAHDDNEPDYLDDKLIKIISLFHFNYHIMELLPNWFIDTSVSDHSIMNAFDLLRHIVDERMHRSAIQEIGNEKAMHRYHQQNSQLRREIERMRRRVRNQRQQIRWKLTMRTGDSFKYQEELVARRWQHINQVRQHQIESALRIKQAHFGLTNKISQLEEDIKHLREQYFKMKAENMKQLKVVREEKNKLLIQLQSTIEKHDRILGEKIKENVYLQDEYDKQREEMDVFMAEFLAVEREYQEIVQAELAEEERIWVEKIRLFFYTRAARVIQYYWRQYLRRKHPGRKLKAKGANKKKR